MNENRPKADKEFTLIEYCLAAIVLYVIEGKLLYDFQALGNMGSVDLLLNTWVGMT